MVGVNSNKKRWLQRRFSTAINCTFAGVLLVAVLLTSFRSTEEIDFFFLQPAAPPETSKAAVQSFDPDPSVVAYAVSFIKCGDSKTQSADLTDASLILRHSIHQISRRNPDSGSSYDYKMYAIVHQKAKDCSKALEDAGFHIVLVDSPVKDSEIKGDHLRKYIRREVCCGSDEFIKLYAYALPEEIIVHVDIDFAFYKPMDDLFDAIRFDKDSPKGMAARNRIHLERPEEGFPDKIDVFLTRDWPQVAPNKFPAPYQAGFLVARRNPDVLVEMFDTIREGNYTPGWGWTCGWGEAGYGGFVGSMAMQGTNLDDVNVVSQCTLGFMAYFYDKIRPNTAVELNQCRYNHMGMDVLYRNQPNFRPRKVKGVGGCRNGASYCEDCMVTDPKDIHSVHFTMCRKPWQCMATGHPGGKIPGGGRATAINTDMVHLSHCLELVSQWHDLRTDFETKLMALTGDNKVAEGSTGEYRPDVFKGHCDGDGNAHYRPISASLETLRRIQELYGD